MQGLIGYHFRTYNFVIYTYIYGKPKNMQIVDFMIFVAQKEYLTRRHYYGW